MSEHIERERLKEAFIADLQKLQTLDEHTMDLILIEIEEAPAADVAEVRHGRWKWIFGKPYCEFCAVEPYRASNKDMPNYCPNCGARMDKEAEYESD